MPDIHRLLPQSPEAEMAALGAALLDASRVLPIFEERGVREEWFHVPANGVIFRFLEAMHKGGMQIDLVTLTQALEDQSELENAGGVPYVSDLFRHMPTTANTAYYLDIIAEKYALRRVIRTCNEYAEKAYEEQHRPGELVDEVQGAFLAIDRPEADAAQKHIQHIKHGVLEAVTSIEELYTARGNILGLPTGFHQLDRMTGGMRGPLLVIVAGRPSMGKSALLMNMAENMALATKKPFLVFSLEMNAADLAVRMVCGQAGVNLQRVRDGFLSQQQMNQKLPGAVQKIMETSIYVDETPGISIQALRTRVRRFIRRHPDTGAIFIDYLQLMRSTSKRAQENRALEIAEISGGLKNLAKEINRPIVAAAQLNRDNDSEKTQPKLSNLRESGSIEQDADWALLIHRKHYYSKKDEDKGQANVDLAKQRNGPVGDISLNFNAELARFENPPGQELYSNNPEHRQGGGPDTEEESPHDH